MNKFGVLSYLSRSGSTFFSKCLNEYSGLCITLECQLPAELFSIKGYTAPIFSGPKEVLDYLEEMKNLTKIQSWDIDFLNPIKYSDLIYPLSSKELVENLLVQYKNRHKPEANTIIYKGSPANPWMCREIALKFEDWKFMHVVRDPRGVYRSQKKNSNPYLGRSFAINPFEIIFDWKKAVKQFGKIETSQALTIRYESLLEDTESEELKVLDFLGEKKTKDSLYTKKYLKSIPEQERNIHANLDKNGTEDFKYKWVSELKDDEISLIQSSLEEEFEFFQLEKKELKSEISALKKAALFLEYKVLIKIYSVIDIAQNAIKNPKYYIRKIKYKVK